jgi:tRNA A-37 threonylcarbamoyl transferase component Bud32
MNNQSLQLHELLSSANLASKLPVTIKASNSSNASTEGNTEFTLVKIIKRVPEKRVVCEGLVNGKTKLIKCFIQHKRHKLHCKRELDANQSLAELTDYSLNCEQLITFESNQVSILAFDFLPNAISLKEQLSAAPCEKDKAIIEQSIQALAELYQKNIIQKDLHLGNILISQQKLYLIDADTMSFYQQKLSAEQILDNYSLFLAQLVPIYQLYTEQFVAKLNGFLDSDQQQSATQVNLKIAQHKQQILLRFKNKTLRKATAFSISHRNGFKIHLDNRYKAISKSALELALEELTKKRPQSRVIVVQKQSYFLHLTKKVQARELWQTAQMLQHERIPALKAIALIEQKRFLGRGKSAFLATYNMHNKQQITEKIINSAALKNQWLTLVLNCYLARIIPTELMQQLTLIDEQLQLCHFDQFNFQPNEAQLTQFKEEIVEVSAGLAIDNTLEGYEQFLQFMS